jgi:hypothetical protein
VLAARGIVTLSSSPNLKRGYDDDDDMMMKLILMMMMMMMMHSGDDDDEDDIMSLMTIIMIVSWVRFVLQSVHEQVSSI